MTPDVFLSYRDIFRMAFRALRRNRLRSALTMLGIMIAIAAVICTVAVGQGGTQRIEDQLTALGINMIWIEAGGRNVNGVRTGNGQTKTLTVDDATAILAGVEGIVRRGTECRRLDAGSVRERKLVHAFPGSIVRLFRHTRLAQERERYFYLHGFARETNVCLLGTTVASVLFGLDDPIGKTIRLQNLPFTVIGIMQRERVLDHRLRPGRRGRDPVHHRHEENERHLLA